MKQASNQLHSLMVQKIEGQQIKINELVEKVGGMTKFTEILTVILNTVEATRTDIKRLSFPENEMRQLAVSLVTNTALLKLPMKKKITDHHHFSKNRTVEK